MMDDEVDKFGFKSHRNSPTFDLWKPLQHAEVGHTLVDGES